MSSQSQLIVVGLDGSERSHDALRFAIAEARLRGCGVRVITSFHDDGSDSRASGEAVQAAARALVDAEIDDPPPVIFELLEGRPEIVLVNASVGATMLVIGAHGVQSIRRAALGSISEYTARMALCPVVVIPAPADEAPAAHLTVPSPA